MDISSLDLYRAISKLRYGLIGWRDLDKINFKVSVELIQADPGTGVMTDCLVLKAIAPPDVTVSPLIPEKETSMIIEIYPFTDQQPARVSKIESGTLTD
jgi:hypothetical protein